MKIKHKIGLLFTVILAVSLAFAAVVFLYAHEKVTASTNTEYSYMFDASSEQTHSDTKYLKQQIIAFSTIMTLLGVIGYRWLVRGVLKPWQQVSTRLYALSNLDYQAAVPCRERRDEVGDMAFALEVLRQNLVRMQEIEQAEKARIEYEIARKGALEHMVGEFDNRVRGVVEAVTNASTQLSSVAERMMGAMNLVQRNAHQLAESTQQSTSHFSNMNASSEDLHQAVASLSRQAQQVSGMSQESEGEVGKAWGSLQELTGASDKIGNVIQLIRKITEKINLLALNAGIESVRAGEAGKGFVVVAQEVKQLASQTKRATQDIVDNILVLQEKSGETKEALGLVKSRIGDIASYNNSMNDAIAAQQKNSNAIAYSMQYASSFISDMDKSTSAIEQELEGIATVTKDVAESARLLNAQSGILSQEVRKFLREIDALEKLKSA